VHILIAPNSFKNSVSALAAAHAIGRGLEQSRYRGSLGFCPVADGGDGTAALLTRHLDGATVAVQVHDPFGRPVHAEFGLIQEGRTAIIELADASGLRLMRPGELNPLLANSFGTGELINEALHRGVREIVLGVGGSATVDGGAGLLQALGVRFLDKAGMPLRALPESLPALSAIDLSRLDGRVGRCAFTVLCDVRNPLLGARGAAAVFGPQKGATPESVRVLEAGLASLSAAMTRLTGKELDDMPRGGAAGGVAAGLYGVLNARLVDGTDYFLDLIDFAAALDGADVVITGEGSIDDQTADGKAPWGVASRAKAKNLFVIGLAGNVPVQPSAMLRSRFDVLMPIGNRPMTLADALLGTAENLQRTAFELGNLLARDLPARGAK
jgi:glycerate kinase